MKRSTQLFLSLCVASMLTLLEVSASIGLAFGVDTGDWPKEIIIDGGRIVMYQMQPEKFEGSTLESRAAVSVEMNKDEKPVFGAVWFSTRLNTVRDAKIAVVTDVTVKDVRFPDQKGNDLQWLKAFLEMEIPKWQLEIDLDQLAATLDLAEKREVAAQKINTDPPRIIFVPKPAVLIPIDGEPRLKKIANTSLMRVVNTPFTLLLSLPDKKYYLYADENTWYVSDNIKGQWKITTDVPAEVAVNEPKKEDDPQKRVFDEDENDVKPGPPPEIYVSTEPAELISSYGEPEYAPISRTDLLYMSNTDSDVLMHIMERKYYVLLAGRWYRSESLDGPWEYVAGKDLPDDFSLIPEDSQMGTVLYAVPGTDAAREAVLNAYVPRTAAVDPVKASLTVKFDGKPKFEQIEGTNLYYAVNSAVPVIWTGRWYYACDQAVWFVAPSPKGPWTVATSVPDSIYLIPPDSPVYHVTFVRVYDARPDVVYVGYTPGYTNTYIYYDTIVYGTGYYWPGWYGDYYYPRPHTWGYHPRWNPWTGWAFGISYSTTPFHFSIGTGGWYRGSWWGPSDYRSYRHGYYHGYRRAKHVNYRTGYYGRDRYDDGRYNIYRGRRNKARVIAIPDRPGTLPLKTKGIEIKRPDYRDHRGTDYRRPGRGNENRPNDRWLQQQGERGGSSQYAPGKRPLKQKEVMMKRPEGPSLSPVPTDHPAPRPSPQPKAMTGNKPQQFDRKWSTQPMDRRPPDTDHNDWAPDSNRSRSFSGTVGPGGPPPGRDGRYR